MKTPEKQKQKNSLSIKDIVWPRKIPLKTEPSSLVTTPKNQSPVSHSPEQSTEENMVKRRGSAMDIIKSNLMATETQQALNNSNIVINYQDTMKVQTPVAQKMRMKRPEEKNAFSKSFNQIGQFSRSRVITLIETSQNSSFRSHNSSFSKNFKGQDRVSTPNYINSKMLKFQPKHI